MTQNCLTACNFNLEFVYIFSGWEGSATDSAMFNDARLTDLHILPGKYYLADAGFPSSLGTVIPYRGIRYHLAEWGRAGLRYVIVHYSSRIRSNCECDSPVNAEELFNLRHSSARNIIERIFGILKNRFSILVIAPHYTMDVQARLAPALAAIHNFIRLYDPDEIKDLIDEAEDIQPGAQMPQMGDLAAGPARAAERALADGKRDGIAQDMWAQYQAELTEREGQ